MLTSVDYGLRLLTLATGLFFAVTGARKLFLADVHAKVSSLFASHGVPVPLQWLIMSGEFLGGLALMLGFLVHIAAAGLVIIMAGAYVMDTWPAVCAKQEWVYGRAGDWEHDWPSYHRRPTSYSKLCSNALCTPEAQLLFIVATLALTGAGNLATIDSLIWR